MESFRIAHVSAGGWAEAAAACARQLLAAGPIAPAGEALGFVYASDAFAADLARIVGRLRETTLVAHWVGTVGLGVLATGREYFDEPALAVMVATLPPGSFRVFPTVASSLDGFRAEHGAWIAAKQPTLAVVHGDPRNPQLPALLSGISEAASCFLVGGLTSSRGTLSQVAEVVADGGVSGVLFAAEVAAATGLSQGCSPIGPIHAISDCRDNVLFELDGRPALEVFKEDVGGLLARDLPRVAGQIHAALPIAGSDTGDYLVRNLVGIDPKRGWLAIGDVPGVGDKIMFCRRDGGTAREDLARMLKRLKRRVQATPRGAVYYSCVARGPNLFGPGSAELGMVRETLGDIPLVGFFCNGEISNARLYGYTGVLTVFL